MRAVIGVTDDHWAAYLRERPQISEANFWLPSGRTAFRALSSGEPFLFKTHWPHNKLVGGGFFSGFAALTVREAWELFGEGNGVGSERELTSAISKYTKAAPDPNALIGCVLLRDLFFLRDHDALDAPADFAKNIVRFKGYDLTAAGSRIDLIFESMLTQAEFRIADERDGHPLVVPGPVLGRERLIRDRVGQQAFRVKVPAMGQPLGTTRACYRAGSLI